MKYSIPGHLKHVSQKNTKPPGRSHDNALVITLCTSVSDININRPLENIRS